MQGGQANIGQAVETSPGRGGKYLRYPPKTLASLRPEAVQTSRVPPGDSFKGLHDPASLSGSTVLGPAGRTPPGDCTSPPL